jgi:hypothetical protein
MIQTEVKQEENEPEVARALGTIAWQTIINIML